ncbi:hypothetical protein DXG03_002882 [Asterophora parasitica]|uniref:Uncharacterized protein n=1 Tax=Asterophora parasitica TaxID=117018 RepID=A0A9P7GBM8_9AGAR|nr:hypothetical protein DXG03_002882 [Asterophora parasitica]
MPFATDIAWPARLRTIFDASRAPHGSLEERYYGPYDKMLNYCFGEGFDFYVAPQAPPADNDKLDTFDFIYLLVLNKSRLPVLFIEVKGESHINNPSKLAAADIHMRSRFNELMHCPLSTALGMRVYAATQATLKLNPPSVSRPATGRVLDASYLANEWDLDILLDDGFRQVKEITSRMSFDTDIAWPADLITIFNVSRAVRGSLEDRYYGPYDKMLNYCFGEGFDFFVAPQATPDAPDFIVYLIVLDKNRLPVLFIEVKGESHINNPSKRAAADIHMRSRFNELMHTCPLPTLHGLSLLGTGMRVYAATQATLKLNPPSVPRPATGRVLDASYLANEWDLDILLDDGFRQVKEITSRMSFDTDIAWPADLITIFNVSRAVRGSLEDRYYGPYDKMLNYCFGEGFDFFVAPQATPDAPDFIVYLIVLDKNRLPVLVIEVMDDSHVNSAPTRDRADTYMRAHFDELLYACPLPALHGLSLLGTGTRVYTGNTATMELNPPSVARPAGRIANTSFLANEWDLDILSDDGFCKMKEIVSFIKHHSVGGASTDTLSNSRQPAIACELL